jgi:hypothetical protein
MSTGIHEARVDSLASLSRLNLHLGIKVEGQLEGDPLVKEALSTAARCAFAKTTFLTKERKAPPDVGLILVFSVESAKVSIFPFKLGEVPSYGASTGYSSYIFDYHASIIYSARIEDSKGQTIVSLDSREAKGSAHEIADVGSMEVESQIGEYAIVRGGPSFWRSGKAAGQAAREAAVETIKWAHQALASRAEGNSS